MILISYEKNNHTSIEEKQLQTLTKFRTLFKLKIGRFSHALLFALDFFFIFSKCTSSQRKVDGHQESFSSMNPMEIPFITNVEHCDPLKTLMVMGSVGEGKSSICNLLANSSEFLFPINKLDTIHMENVTWRESQEPFCLIDTPGLFAHDRNRENEILDQMISELKTKVQHVNTFAIVLNGTNPRFDQSRKQMIRVFMKIFGSQIFEKNTVFIISHWSYNEYSVEKRIRTNQDEVSKTNGINKILQEFGVKNSAVPVIFIASKSGDDSVEQEKLNIGLEELKHYLFNFQPYLSKNFQFLKSEN